MTESELRLLRANTRKSSYSMKRTLIILSPSVLFFSPLARMLGAEAALVQTMFSKLCNCYMH